MFRRNPNLIFKPQKLQNGGSPAFSACPSPPPPPRPAQPSPAQPSPHRCGESPFWRFQASKLQNYECGGITVLAFQAPPGNHRFGVFKPQKLQNGDSPAFSTLKSSKTVIPRIFCLPQAPPQPEACVTTVEAAANTEACLSQREEVGILTPKPFSG